MGYSALICITILFFSMHSCGSSGEKATKKGETDSLKQSNVKQDSVPKPPPLSPRLSPGTTRVKGKVVAVHPSQDGKGGTIDFEVLQFLGVGSSASIAAPQDTLTAKISALPESFKEGKEFIGILRSRHVLAKFKGSAPRWQLVGIEQNLNQ